MVYVSSLKPAATVACSSAMLSSKAEIANTDDILLELYVAPSIIKCQLVYYTDMHVHVHVELTCRAVAHAWYHVNMPGLSIPQFYHSVVKSTHKLYNNYAIIVCLRRISHVRCRAEAVWYPLPS